MEKVAEFTESDYPSISGRRILFFVNNFESLTLHRKSLIEALVTQGVELHIATPLPHTGDGEVVNQSAVTLHWLALSRKGKNPFQDLATLAAFRRIIKKVKPHLIHNFTIKPVIYGSIAARWERVPAVVNTITGLGHVFVDETFAGALTRQITYRLYRWALKGPNLEVIFQNPDDLAVFREANLLGNVEPVLIPGSGVDPDLYTPAPPKSGSGPCRIVFAGRLLWTKGLGELAEAMSIIKAGGSPECELHLFGDLDPGNPAGIEESQIAQWEQQGLLKWHGPTNDMVTSIQAADIACLPSYREGISRFLLEAASCEKPIITTSAPGGTEIVTNGMNGILVPPKNAEALAEAITQLAKSPELRIALGRKGRETVLNKFTENRVNDMVLEVYNKILGKN